MANQLYIGCIADDFTGASDAASFLTQGGLKTLLLNGVPEDDRNIDDDFTAIVIALKTRTQEVKKAVYDTNKAFEWLRKRKAVQIFLKYCSTFDSTRHGNIGPIVDNVLNKTGSKYTILCPAVPINKRIVRNGCLYVDGVPLNESSMKHHPLTPMWDSDIANLMKPQGKYECLKLDQYLMKKPKEEILSLIHRFGSDKEHFYVIPDFVYDEDAKKIVDVFGDLVLLTGGSGLMTELAKRYSNSDNPSSGKVSMGTAGHALILSGSCSQATLAQIDVFKHRGGKSIKIDSSKLTGSEEIERLWDFVLEHRSKPVLVYSSNVTAHISEEVKQSKQWRSVAGLLEDTAAEIAWRAVKAGFTRIIVAGGETSGAVTKRLGYNSLLIGESVSPGVPIMIPINDNKMRIVLKSGNFGGEDFFIRALDMTKE
ncbi:3-oxo-tetronate kinase [Sediminispirochaeta smaragdinae]|uniref:3-oxo-tetronate kinase n=1 Tax=Sediminispirochaeta smaragdinae (strain DSM 11293 / JCM 15392 / SEBR 4228) TaxID=573413 RepID=E1RAK8_SEDSS|nr:3-oxo-tetronate kinase [Sediminispirochaeta smaragdinae]ADK82376.1 type III effector Hrp-dependent outer protein [Sediminispirochaeta smaragdinae DSM 11293]